MLERDMPRALALYDEARSAHGVRPDAYTLKLMLDACSRSGDAAAGLALCAEARAEGVPLDAAARGAMLRACLQQGMPDEAMRLFEEGREAGEAAAPLNLLQLGLLSDGCFRASGSAGSAAEKELWLRRALDLYGAGKELVDSRALLPLEPRAASPPSEREPPRPAPPADNYSYRDVEAGDNERNWHDLVDWDKVPEPAPRTPNPDVPTRRLLPGVQRRGEVRRAI